MKSPLVILHLEVDPHDAALVQARLKAAGMACSIKRVDNATAFVLALEEPDLDLVLSDIALPGFESMSALEIIRKRHPDMPFIIVSGTTGQEVAIELLKRGATDYVLKDRLSRLAPAVRRAMEEVRGRRERHRLEQQLIEPQKMEVVGHLAGGIAHDFNNIIGVIMGYCDLTTQQFQPGDPIRENIETIRHAAERAAALTRQLLVFSRRQTLQPSVLDLNQVLADLDKMLRRLIHEDIILTVTPQRELWRVKADSGYVGQVLMNLVVNARDAMPNGGELNIETRNVTWQPDGATTRPDAAAGNYVLLSVSDTGVGMTAEVKARLFEAFFTTKPKGKGTGLGLATCQTIVKQCGGHIDVQSQPGKGTTFKVYFPSVDLPLDAAAWSASAKPLPRGTETLLLVEDEPAVRHLACDALEAQGYRVLRASNGREGLRVAREFKGQPIGLVITDVVMPRMSGKVMAKWLKATYPKLKVLFTSGYTDDPITQHGIAQPGVAFLPKPYTPSSLALKARELLDSPIP